MSLARRSVTSAAWNSIASVARLVVLFARYVVLARLLPVDTFGVYAGANALVQLTVLVAAFGMGGAFLHRAPETEDENQAASVHLTLKLVFTLAWAGLMLIGSALFATGETRTALLLLTITTAGTQLAQTPQLILIRRVVHRRLALLQLLNALLTTLVAVGLAWGGATLWALLATDVATMILTLAVLYGWRPVWRPRLAWTPDVMRYFLRFGSRNFAAVTLLQALDKFDDLWTRFFLGTTAMGYYSRAYNFATYPRTILAAPINTVAGGTYAELKENRQRLSRAFFRTNAFLVRSGFFLAGFLALTAPEFIRLLVGDKWLPMLDAFRLMLVFTLLDPIKITVSNLFIAVGKPEKVVQARLIQLAVLLTGLFTLGPTLGIAGVALSVDVMLVVGIALLLWQARTHVDFSARRLFAVPMLALILGIAAARAAITIPGVLGSDWRTGAVKTVVFCVLYVGIMILLERDQVSMLLNIFSMLRPKDQPIT
ncbi:MAG: oligosaccharide flippase family protein [Anaerolineae bacterium]|jgi:O-antigen/teichoic acid export membrane protein